MPNCVVKGCKNHSTKNKKQDGITFHTFPNRHTDIKEKWVEVIRASRNEPSWNPTARSVVCSIHFEDEDFYTTNKGLRRVVQNGYPKHLPDETNQTVKAEMDLTEPTVVCADVTATPIESVDVDPIQPCSSRADVPATPNESIDVDPTQPCSSQAHFPVIRVKSFDVDPIQTRFSQAHDPVTPIVSIIDVDPIQHYTVQSHFLAAPSTPTPSIKDEDESIFDTPRKYRLRQRILRLEKKQIDMKRNIKTLNQKVRRLNERNKSLKGILHNLKKQNYMDTDLYNSLNGNITVIDIFNALNRKKVNKKIKFTAAMKKFCLTLNYYSPKAYQYVRYTFNTCLPHPKTLAKMCRHIKSEHYEGNLSSTQSELTSYVTPTNVETSV